MHVCHVNLSNVLGGGTLQTLALIEALGTRITQSIVLRRDSPLHAAVSTLDWLDVRAVPNSILAATRAAGHTELLHIHEGRSMAIGALRSLFSGIPFIATRGLAQQPKSMWLARWSYKRAATVVGVSTAVTHALRAYSHDLVLATIPDCVRSMEQDPEHVKRLRESARGSVVVGHVGVLQDAIKGQRLILEAARKLQVSDPDILFWLIGSGSDEQDLRNAARDLANVIFVGWTDRVADYYAAMDIFIFPSRKEGLGSSLLEAMSFSLPIIGTRVGGIPDLVEHGTTGLLIDSNKSSQLVDAIRQLANSGELRQVMGENGKARSRTFSSEERADRYLDLYRRTVAPEMVKSSHSG